MSTEVPRPYVKESIARQIATKRSNAGTPHTTRQVEGGWLVERVDPIVEPPGVEEPPPATSRFAWRSGDIGVMTDVVAVVKPEGTQPKPATEVPSDEVSIAATWIKETPLCLVVRVGDQEKWPYKSLLRGWERQGEGGVVLRMTRRQARKWKLIASAA